VQVSRCALAPAPQCRLDAGTALYYVMQGSLHCDALMNNRSTQILVGLSFLFCLLALLLTVGDFLALHDIGNDYVSGEILTHLGVSLSKPLPAWTATTGEWRLVEISWILRVVFFLVNAVTLVLCLRALRRQRNEEALAPSRP